ncbi:MAG TPA: sigma 54-interacting transcriptional regulator [Terriglobia bacterium]|nr:sigma 54-interacting transcriptional regulator [Terriglobia bacterium]
METLPKLVSIAGPLRRSAYPLTGKTFTIGREPSSSLSIDDQYVSRRHCIIQVEDGTLRITDLNSHNGTFVNSIPIKKRDLNHGDQIMIGGSTFVVVLKGEEPSAAATWVAIDDRRSSPSATLEMPAGLPVGLDRLETGAPALAGQRALRDLETLLRISSEVSSLQGLGDIQCRLLQSIFEVVPADRGAIILAENNLDEITSIFGWDRAKGMDREVHVNRAALRDAYERKVALLSELPAQNETAIPSSSLAPFKSLLAVPLVTASCTLGVIYLETVKPSVRFDQRHLEMVSAIAGMGAIALQKAQRLAWLEEETRRLQEEISRGHDMVGESPRMQEVYRFIARAAPSSSTVLISGESGTGKELVARALHQHSLRKGKPFVAINCAALTESLLESELFGHEKGAFTGALALKKGKLELADTGTMFLDEIGELAPLLQAKLLRVLQERELDRLGGARPIKVDIRLIAATNRNLADEVTQGRFRQDLYYRLNVVSITMPPLRERREDIPLLASYFAVKHGQKSNRLVKVISPEARACLMNYDWPGNIRELENAIERAVVLGSSEMILPEDLPEALLESQPPSNETNAQYQKGVRDAKKQIILNALEQSGGNYTEAAKLLGVRATYLHRLARNLNLKSKVK